MNKDDVYVGMRVIVNDRFAGMKSLAGKHGTVVAVLDGVQNCIGITFDDPFDAGHTCGGRCTDGHGRWGRPEEIDPESEGGCIIKEMEISYDSLF